MTTKKISYVQYDLGESDIHIKAKDKMSRLCLNNNIILTDHSGKQIFLNTNNIAQIQQEFTWYQGTRIKPIKSFSADVVLLDKNNQIIAIIEIVKTNGLSNKKYNFYQSLNVFWVELAAEHILTEDSSFVSSFTYNNFTDNHIKPTFYFTEDKITQSTTTKKEKREILENQIQKLRRKLRRLDLNVKKNFNIPLSDTDQKEAIHLRNQIKKLTNKLKKLGLSKRQKKSRNKQIIKSKAIKKKNQKIIKATSKTMEKPRPKIIPNKKIRNRIKQFLVRSGRTKVSVSEVIRYTEGFLMVDERFELTKAIISFLRRHNWSFQNGYFIFIG